MYWFPSKVSKAGELSLTITKLSKSHLILDKFDLQIRNSPSYCFLVKGEQITTCKNVQNM